MTKYPSMNIVISPHAKERFAERFNIADADIPRYVEQNCRDACIYHQGKYECLLIGRLFVMGLKKDVGSYEWTCVTVMSEIPYYVGKKKTHTLLGGVKVFDSPIVPLAKEKKPKNKKSQPAEDEDAAEDDDDEGGETEEESEEDDGETEEIPHVAAPRLKCDICGRLHKCCHQRRAELEDVSSRVV